MNVVSISEGFAYLLGNSCNPFFALVDHVWGGTVEIFLWMTHHKVALKLQGISHSFALRIFELLQL